LIASVKDVSLYTIGCIASFMDVSFAATIYWIASSLDVILLDTITSWIGCFVYNSIQVR
jgi:hypothetical protein